MHKVELLSPVGNWDMLYQAIHNGADAIYLAGHEFGARKFALNFTNDELVDAIKYSHLYGVMVYVTVNTLILESEIEKFLEYIKFLHENNVDAVIMQDIGMIAMVRKCFPDLVIHASTQAHNHNEEGVKLLKDLGVKRVVLAREMSLQEINKINVKIEKEVFVYGALCVCYSGQCLFSSLNGGRSGNRGECVGSCRLAYKIYKNDTEVKTNGNYLLSMKDLNTFNHLEELLSSNIDSLKIEGRMKSPYYVGYVTRLYRILIDKYYNGQPLSLTDEEIFNLKKLFNREFTDGYLFNASDITNIKSPNHIGIKIGEVVSTDQNFISIKITNDILNQEDAIRFKKANVGMVVNKLYNSKKLLVNHIDKNSICLIDNKMDVKIKKGDIVLKTIDKKLITDLSKYESKKIEISFNAEFKINQNFKVTISDGINTFTAFGPIVDLAKTHEVLKEDIEKLLTKLGNTPFLCSHIDINKDDNIFVSLKSINEVRRQLIEQLIKAREGEARKITYNVVEKDRKNTINNNITINALVRNEEQLKCCLDNNVNKIYVTDYELYKKYKNNKTIYYRLDQVMNHFLDFDHDNLLVGELGSVNKYHLNNELITDYYLNVTNSKSIEFLNDMNVKQVTLSVELKYQDICDIMKKNYNVELIVYGRLELMIMKYCPFKKIFNSCINCNNIKDKFYLIDKNNNKYPIISSKCLTHIMHYKNINLIAEISQYRKINITNFRLEFFDENNLEITNIINLVKKELNIK